MKKKLITIITGESVSLGSGHMQRMRNLHAYINEQSEMQARLIVANEKEQQPCVCIDSHTDLILRDMRDSDTREIDAIKRRSKILVIDDYGPGRQRADYVLDILPHPLQQRKPAADFFLYGHNFTRSLQEIGTRTIEKTIDVILYPGHIVDDFYCQLIRALAEKYTVGVLQGNDSYLQIQGARHSLHDKSYAETMLAAKVVLSHFGLLLYEGKLAGCKLLSIQPTFYHSQLADLVKDDMGLVNLGEKNALQVEAAAHIISRHIRTYTITEVSPIALYAKIRSNLHTVYQYVASLLKN